MTGRHQREKKSAARPSLDILFAGVLPPFPGGAAISCAGLLAGLAAAGHRVRALAPITAEGLRAGDVYAGDPNIQVTRFVVPFYQFGSDPATSEYRLLERGGVQTHLPALIAERRPDVIVAGRETFARDLPDIAAAHGIPSVLRIAGSVTWAIHAGTYPEALARPLLRQFRKFRLIVAQARHVKAKLNALGFDHVSVVRNGVDLDHFAPGSKSRALLRELAIDEDEIVVSHPSNLKPIKRPLDLLESARQTMREDNRLVYVVVGDGHCRSLMEEACRRERLLDRFRFVGWIDYARMPDYIRLADIVVMPSETEQQARVYLETQACARVLLASDIDAVREVAVDRETALLFQKGDIADLTAKTLLAAGDAALRTRIGREARKRARAFSWTEVVAAWSAELQNIARTSEEERKLKGTG